VRPMREGRAQRRRSRRWSVFPTECRSIRAGGRLAQGVGNILVVLDNAIEPPPAKHEPSQVAARTPRPAEQPPPARPKPSQVAARALQPVAPPPAAKSEPSEAGARVLRPAALAPARTGLSQVAARARQPAANPGAQEAPRRAVRYQRQ
jgi:hypothetical protein